MSHFYGVVEGSRGKATRCGTKSSGIKVQAAGWHGAVEVQVFQGINGEDRYHIWAIPWPDNGEHITIAEGRLDANDKREGFNV